MKIPTSKQNYTILVISIIAVLFVGTSNHLISNADAQTVTCSDEIKFDKDNYSSYDTKAIITVKDSTSNKASSVDQIQVDVFSTSDAGGLKIILTETGLDTATFVGEINLTYTDESSRVFDVRFRSDARHSR